MIGKYKVITLCGSTKFKDDFMRIQKKSEKSKNTEIKSKWPF
jgi:hypothetical protein